MIPEQDARQAIMLAGQGANVSGIARRLGHDRKTIRIYLNGHRAPGQPRPHADSFAPFAAYVRQRAYDDRHLRAAGLHREITALGYAGSYSAFTRELRGHGITAACGTCRSWKPITPAQAPRRYPVPLPFRTAPVAGETIASYLTRAAAASHLPAGVITACLPSWFAARAAACPAARAARARHQSRPPAGSRRSRLPALRLTGKAARAGPGPHPRAPAGLRTAPHLARPRHPDRPGRRPGHHQRLPARCPPRPAARHHQARARRDDRPPADGRHGRQPALPAARRGARVIEPRPGHRAPGHGRSSGLPRDDQTGRRDPQRPWRTTRRAGITGKTPPLAPPGQLR